MQVLVLSMSDDRAKTISGNSNVEIEVEVLTDQAIVIIASTGFFQPNFPSISPQIPLGFEV